jgi:hypothetical protein
MAMNAERDVGKRLELQAGSYYLLRGNILILAIGPRAALSIPRGQTWDATAMQGADGPLTAKEIVDRFPWYSLDVLEFDAAIARQGEKRGY